MPKNKKFKNDKESHQTVSAAAPQVHPSEAVRSGPKPAQQKASAFLNACEGYLGRSLYRDNPVLTGAVALCTLLAATGSLKNALLLSLVNLCVTVLLYFAFSFFYHRLHEKLRLPALVLAAGAVVTPLCGLSQYLAPEVTASVGIFLPLTAVNAALFFRARAQEQRRPVSRSLLLGLRDSLGFAAAAIVLGVLREPFGSGTLYGRALPGFFSFKFSFALLPPGAFLLLGLLFALFQGIKLHAERRRGKRGNGGETK